MAGATSEPHETSSSTVVIDLTTKFDNDRSALSQVKDYYIPKPRLSSKDSKAAKTASSTIPQTEWQELEEEVWSKNPDRHPQVDMVRTNGVYSFRLSQPLFASTPKKQPCSATKCLKMSSTQVRAKKLHYASTAGMIRYRMSL